ncbi:MAG: P-loop NTPase fold protein [Cyclobacteriaceae bacterium]
MYQRVIKYFPLVLVWSLPIVFHRFFENLIDTYWVLPFASQFDRSVFTDILFLLCIAASVYVFYYSKWVIRKSLDWNKAVHLIFIGSYFIAYRFQLFGFDHWEFERLYLVPTLRYVDLFLFGLVLLLLYRIIEYTPAPQQSDLIYSILEDHHVTTPDQDRLARREFAEYLAKHITNNSATTAFAIGINAKWGDGKTSYQEMVKKFVGSQDQSAICFDFNPWKSSNANKIVSDFFEAYSDKIGFYDFNLGSQIKEYGRKLLSGTNTWWSTLFDSILGRDNQEALHKKINDSLESVNRRVVIFVDDLDRLTTPEIMEVVKLIRNSANFRNTFFVVGYDLEYLQEVLANHNEYGQEHYLEKIFQIQIDLNAIPGSVIVEQLKDHLSQMLPSYADNIKAVLGYQPSVNEAFEASFLGRKNASDLIPGVLKNLRDVKRFANFFAVSFRLLASEVDFEDFFYISLLKFKYPVFIRKIKTYEKGI